jgi:hypothetical protein
MEEDVRFQCPRGLSPSEYERFFEGIEIIPQKCTLAFRHSAPNIPVAPGFRLFYSGGF